MQLFHVVHFSFLALVCRSEKMLKLDTVNDGSPAACFNRVDPDQKTLEGVAEP